MSPVRVLQMLDEYFAAMLDPIRRHGGVVSQFQGDAILATFNVPLENERHADLAVRTALDMQAANARMQFAGVQLRTRIGINTGPVVAGNVGAGDRVHYTVHGDAVNVAARLEALNKTHGTATLVSGSTVAVLDDGYPLAPMGKVRIAGKGVPVSVHRLDAVDQPERPGGGRSLA